MMKITKEYLKRQASYAMEELHDWQGRKEKDLRCGVGENAVTLQEGILINIGELRALGRLARIDFNLMYTKFSAEDFRSYETIQEKINQLEKQYII